MYATDAAAAATAASGSSRSRRSLQIDSATGEDSPPQWLVVSDTHTSIRAARNEHVQTP